MRTPKLKDLINRYVKCIKAENPNSSITDKGITFLTEQWRGKEEKLYSIVKELENKVVKIKNLSERVERVVVTYNTGVDVLGFPTYTTHETLFQLDIDRKYVNNHTGYRVLDAIQYEHK